MRSFIECPILQNCSARAMQNHDERAAPPSHPDGVLRYCVPRRRHKVRHRAPALQTAPPRVSCRACFPAHAERMPATRTLDLAVDALAERLGAERLERAAPLAPHTTFKIGGPADLMYRALSQDELARAVLAARE